MVEVVEAGFGLVSDFTCDVCIREMTLRACELLVVGDMPSGVYVIHAVARPAYYGTARSMISADYYGHEDGTDNNASKKDFLRGQAGDFFPTHFQIPHNCLMSYQMETPCVPE
jgi:hypothetical protein